MGGNLYFAGKKTLFVKVGFLREDIGVLLRSHPPANFWDVGEALRREWVQTRIWISLSSNSILVPRELEQCAQRYSNFSPSGRIRRRRLRTGTAWRQRVQTRA